MIECLVCEGDGYLWDPEWCGDDEHCSPGIECDNCDGSGWVKEEGEASV